MAIKIQGSTIIDDSRNIVSAGIATINTKIDVGAGGTIFSADANVSNDNILSVKNVSLNPAFDITGTGSVGIGITNPSKSLHIDGTGLLVASGSTTLFSVESFTPNSNVFEVYDRENSIILGVSTNSVGIGSTNIFTITPQVTQTAIGVGTAEILTLASNAGNQDIFTVTDESGGLTYFTVTNNGNVGLGTTNPTEKFHINAGNLLVSSGTDEILYVSQTGNNSFSIQTQSSNPAFDVTGIGSVGIGTAQPSGVFQIVEGGNEVFSVSSSPSNNILDVGTDKFVVSTGGSVGVGTTNPTSKLDVVGDLKVTGVSTISIADTTSYDPANAPVSPTSSDLLTLVNPDQTTDGYTGIYFQHKSNDIAWGRMALQGNFFGSPQHAFVFTMRGPSGLSNNEKFRIGNTGTISFKGDTDTYITGDGSDAVQIFTAGSEKLRISSGGNIGIGTDNPQYKLHVIGDFGATTKSFVIPHPTKQGMTLRHGSLEGPENGVYVRGKTTESIIPLPDYWTGLVDEDSITVNLTPKNGKLHSVVGVSYNTVEIECIGGDIDCYFMVLGERKDVAQLQVEY